mmetsp:Transcript_56178/g.149963  ORF Transcript_56178/g.149963 Transcript_56178/m.149963 type:complete len:199 (-) Transcript_56178:222-818(-)
MAASAFSVSHLCLVRRARVHLEPRGLSTLCETWRQTLTPALGGETPVVSGPWLRRSCRVDSDGALKTCSAWCFRASFVPYGMSHGYEVMESALRASDWHKISMAVAHSGGVVLFAGPRDEESECLWESKAGFTPCDPEAAHSLEGFDADLFAEEQAWLEEMDGVCRAPQDITTDVLQQPRLHLPKATNVLDMSSVALV